MKKGDKDVSAFFYTIYDNPTIPKDEIEKLKNNTPEYIWNLEYMAQESAYSGQMYDEFSRETNVEVIEMPEGSLAFRGVDWGMKHPTSCIFVKLDLSKKLIYVYDEYVKAGEICKVHAETITKMTGDTKVGWTVCDPTMAKRDPQTGRTDILEFSRYGVHMVAADNGDRGYDVVKMFLKTGMLKIHPKCRQTIIELENYQRGDAEGDDCLDPLRYVCLRIHDTINGMNHFEQAVGHSGQIEQRPKGVYNLFDHIFMGKRSEDSAAQWAMDMAGNDDD
mgnify:CR=1 FL=1